MVPFKGVAMDIIGPIFTHIRNVNLYIIVVGDYSSEYKEVIHCGDIVHKLEQWYSRV